MGCNLMIFAAGEEVRAIVIGIGLNSQWGKIKANLVSEATNTPLQDKLEDMAEKVCITQPYLVHY